MNNLNAGFLALPILLVIGCTTSYEGQCDASLTPVGEETVGPDGAWTAASLRDAAAGTIVYDGVSHHEQEGGALLAALAPYTFTISGGTEAYLRTWSSPSNPRCLYEGDQELVAVLEVEIRSADGEVFAEGPGSIFAGSDGLPPYITGFDGLLPIAASFAPPFAALEDGCGSTPEVSFGAVLGRDTLALWVQSEGCALGTVDLVEAAE